jgi:hypothetical protein
MRLPLLKLGFKRFASAEYADISAFMTTYRQLLFFSISESSLKRSRVQSLILGDLETVSTEIEGAYFFFR